VADDVAVRETFLAADALPKHAVPHGEAFVATDRLSKYGRSELVAVDLPNHSRPSVRVAVWGGPGVALWRTKLRGGSFESGVPAKDLGILHVGRRGRR